MSDGKGTGARVDVVGGNKGGLKTLQKGSPALYLFTSWLHAGLKGMEGKGEEKGGGANRLREIRALVQLGMLGQDVVAELTSMLQILEQLGGVGRGEDGVGWGGGLAGRTEGEGPRLLLSVWQMLAGQLSTHVDATLELKDTLVHAMLLFPIAICVRYREGPEERWSVGGVVEEWGRLLSSVYAVAALKSFLPNNMVSPAFESIYALIAESEAGMGWDPERLLEGEGLWELGVGVTVRALLQTELHSSAAAALSHQRRGSKGGGRRGALGGAASPERQGGQVAEREVVDSTSIRALLNVAGRYDEWMVAFWLPLKLLVLGFGFFDFSCHILLRKVFPSSPPVFFTGDNNIRCYHRHHDW